MDKSLFLLDLIQILVNAAHKGCHLIEYLGSNAKVKTKKENDPVTQIDHSIQNLIVSSVIEKYPTINIVGEEKLDEHMLVNFEASHLKNLENLEKQIEVNFNWEREIFASELCIFIDPLDCTRGYISNKKWQCTILIGIVFENKPIFGIISQPYINKNFTSVFSPSILLGGVALKSSIVYEISFVDKQCKWKKWSKMQSLGNKSIAVSCRRNNKKQKQIMKHLGLAGESMGGSGNKIAMVIRGETDAAMFIDMPTSSWDFCAGDAIILGMGGFFVKPNLTPLTYYFTKEDQTNYQGFVCCLNQGLFNKFTQILS